MARRIAALYGNVEDSVLRLVAGRLARGLSHDDWGAQRLAETMELRRQVRREVTRLLRQVPPEASTLVAEAWAAGEQQAAADLARSSLHGPEEPPFAVLPSEAARRTLEAALAGTLDSTSMRIVRSADDLYRSVIGEVTRRGLSGDFTRRQAAQSALDRFAARGVTGFTDRMGRSWSLSSYTEMACRTTAAQASLEAKSAKYRALGHDLVVVSDAPGECSLCRPYEGKVLSLTGADPEHPSLDSAIAAGLFHPNCRHDYHLYAPGLTRPMHGTADPEGDRARQQQRYLERGIRSWKLREAAALDDQASRYAKAKQREWQARLREHIDATGGKRLRYREQVRRAI